VREYTATTKKQLFGLETASAHSLPAMYIASLLSLIWPLSSEYFLCISYCILYLSQFRLIS